MRMLARYIWPTGGTKGIYIFYDLRGNRRNLQPERESWIVKNASSAKTN